MKKTFTTHVVFQENLCLSQESYTAHAEPTKKDKKKKKRPGVFFALRALPASWLTHSLLTLGSLAEIAI